MTSERSEFCRRRQTVVKAVVVVERWPDTESNGERIPMVCASGRSAGPDGGSRAIGKEPGQRETAYVGLSRSPCCETVARIVRPAISSRWLHKRA
jgi:hypothetical protein